MYDYIISSLENLFESQTNPITNSALLAARIFESLPQLNWAGFYFLTAGGSLHLGPFQGKTACIRIEMGNGVCGAAAAKRETLVVEDVNAFDGHIACDAASQSEIVIPIIKNGHLYGVLDIDSPIIGRFSNEDKKKLESIVEIFIDKTDFRGLREIFK